MRSPVDSGLAETIGPADSLRAPASVGVASERIGPYVLLEIVGQGGFGVVWLAEQREPVRRRVALKLIRPGMDSDEVIARFRAEQQALALMNHPNVARVFDAGTTERGLPYFVMEFVAGEPITRYCDRQRLPLAERLRLFTHVCDAVHHAHMRGVIHRDLKPSNILVSVPDADSSGGEPRPVVIDFGVAKALHQRLTDTTVHTKQGFLVGTPEYMSPEQAEMFGTDVDTRTDIYALGVVLYELLTGALPFEPESLRRAGYDEIRRIIREVEPPRPSTRLTSMVAARAAAEARQTRSEELVRTLRSELEWIPMFAMRKDRTRRYRSAAEFADDIRNYLSGRALIAGPESATYRARKFVRRNRGVVAAAGSVLVALVLGLVGTLWQALRADERARAAEAAERKAEAINEFVQQALQSADPFEGGAQDMTVVEAMRNALREIEAGAFRDQPDIEAGILSTIADVLLNNGDAEEARRIYDGILQAQLERWDRADRIEVVDAMNDLASAEIAMGDVAEAERLLTLALEMHRRLPERDEQDVALLLNNVASVREDLGRLHDAESLLRESLAIREGAVRGDDEDLANTLNNLSSVRAALGDLDEAESLCRKALEMRQRLLGADHPEVANSLNNLAILVMERGRASDAEMLNRRALAIRRRSFAGDHPLVADSLCHLAQSLVSRGEATEAEPLAREALAMRRRLYPDGHPDVANSLHTVATIDFARGDVPAAEHAAREAVAVQERVAPESARALLLKATLARIVHAQGREDDARSLMREVLDESGRHGELSTADRASIEEARREVAHPAGAVPPKS